MTLRNILMATDCEYVKIPQAFDGIADVQDTMDADMAYLDAEAVAVVEGNTLKVVHLAYTFKVVDPVADDVDVE